SVFFFFQAEDGIRDRNVTGVQTCALPILRSGTRSARPPSLSRAGRRHEGTGPVTLTPVRAYPDRVDYTCYSIPMRTRFRGLDLRSEERRVGKECGGRRERAR